MRPGRAVSSRPLVLLGLERAWGQRFVVRGSRALLLQGPAGATSCGSLRLDVEQRAPRKVSECCGNPHQSPVLMASPQGPRQGPVHGAGRP